MGARNNEREPVKCAKSRDGIRAFSTQSGNSQGLIRLSKQIMSSSLDSIEIAGSEPGFEPGSELGSEPGLET